MGVKQLPSFAIDKSSVANTEHKINLTVVESAKQLALSSQSLVAIINKSPFNIHYTKANGDYIAAEEIGFFNKQQQVIASNVKVEPVADSTSSSTLASALESISKVKTGATSEVNISASVEDEDKNDDFAAGFTLGFLSLIHI